MLNPNQCPFKGALRVLTKKKQWLVGCCVAATKHVFNLKLFIRKTSKKGKKTVTRLYRVEFFSFVNRLTVLVDRVRVNISIPNYTIKSVLPNWLAAARGLPALFLKTAGEFEDFQILYGLPVALLLLHNYSAKRENINGFSIRAKPYRSDDSISEKQPQAGFSAQPKVKHLGMPI